MESQQQVMIDGNLRIAEATRRALEGIRTESPTYAEMTIDSVVVMIDKLGRWMANAMAQEETPDEMAARNGNAHGEGVYIKGRPGMRVRDPDGDCGVIVSTSTDGCFVRRQG